MTACFKKSLYGLIAISIASFLFVVIYINPKLSTNVKYYPAIYENMKIDERTSEEVNINELTILSYNIWFDEYLQSERTAKLLSMIKTMNPDIICLQEVTRTSLNAIRTNKYIATHFELAHSVSSLNVNSYGVIIGINQRKNNLSVREVQVSALQSKMTRKLLSLHIEYNQAQSLWINTVHLESLFNTNTRIKQMQYIFDEKMKHQSDAILTGDFNFGDGDVENEYIPKEFTDCWVKYKEENGLMGDGITHKGDGKRLDRILLRSKRWRVQYFQIIGEENMPSDHFGIFTSIVL